MDMSGPFWVSLLELTRICKASGEQGSRLQMFCVLCCKNRGAVCLTTFAE